MTTRREFLIVAAAWPVLAWAGAVLAQAKQLPVVIGWLNNTHRESNRHYLVAFRDGMAALDWREGHNYILEERWANSESERLPSLALDLAERKPAVILAATLGAVRAAAKSAPGIPIVQADGGSLVDAGLAVSLARPGRMVTGITNVAADFAPKFLELLLEVVPGAKRVGFLVDSSNSLSPPLVATYRSMIDQRRIRGHFAEVGNASEIEPALAKLARDRIQGLVLLPATFFVAERQRIVKIALSNRWPLTCGPHEFTESGALLSYGSDRTALYRRSAYYVDRILKGTRPGDLPIEQPTRFELVVNMKTARTLGIAMPPSIMARADRVIE